MVHRGGRKALAGFLDLCSPLKMPRVDSQRCMGTVALGLEALHPQLLTCFHPSAFGERAERMQSAAAPKGLQD